MNLVLATIENVAQKRSRAETEIASSPVLAAAGTGERGTGRQGFEGGCHVIALQSNLSS